MISVDRRSGSKELLPMFPRNCAILDDLPAGDFCFRGNGPDGRVLIGVERKAIRDMLGSMRSGRLLGHQIPAMKRMYDFSFIVLEGYYTANLSGILVSSAKDERPITLGHYGQTFLARELFSFSIGIWIWHHIMVLRTMTKRETVHAICDIQRYFGKQWDKHKMGKAMNAKMLPPPANFMKQSLVARWAADLPGIGHEKAGAVDGIFASGQDLANAEPKEWLIKGAIGPKLSERAVSAIRRRRKVPNEEI